MGCCACNGTGEIREPIIMPLNIKNTNFIADRDYTRIVSNPCNCKYIEAFLSKI